MRTLLKWLGGLLILLLVSSTAIWFCLFRPPPSGTLAQPLMTASGPIQGIEQQGLTIYRGLPYAMPPVGNLRWRAPQPVAAWTKMRNAATFGRACPQIGGPVPGLSPEPQSEDCLYVNVWTPAKPDDKPLAVIVWLHGGSDMNGSGSAYPYWGDRLARKGVVVVSVNYRLGALGFLAHPELSKESGHNASGNYGMMDIAAALRWVQANARAFGGDPGNVTVMGHSAGAWNLSQIQASPLTAGLYRRIIAMSGGNFGPSGTKEGIAYLPDAEAAGLHFAAHLGAKSLAELRAIPAQRIIEAPVALWRDRANANNTPATVDGYVIPFDPHGLYASGNAHPVDLLIGYTAGEGIDLGRLPVSAAQYRTEVEKTYGAFASSILRLYPAGSDEEANRSSQRLHDEHDVKWQMASWARLHAGTKKGRVYFYRFSHTPGIGPFRKLGPGHGSELGYVFDFPKRAMRYGTQWPWDARRDSAMVDMIQTYWVNFARTGNPNGAALPNWPAFADGQQAIDLGDEVRAISWPDAEEHRLMDAYMEAVSRPRSTVQPGGS